MRGGCGAGGAGGGPRGSGTSFGFSVKAGRRHCHGRDAELDAGRRGGGGPVKMGGDHLLGGRMGGGLLCGLGVARVGMGGMTLSGMAYFLLGGGAFNGGCPTKPA